MNEPRGLGRRVRQGTRGRHPCVVNTPTSGREDGIVECVQSTAWMQARGGETANTAEHGRIQRSRGEIRGDVPLLGTPCRGMPSLAKVSTIPGVETAACEMSTSWPSRWRMRRLKPSSACRGDTRANQRSTTGDEPPLREVQQREGPSFAHLPSERRARSRRLAVESRAPPPPPPPPCPTQAAPSAARCADLPRSPQISPDLPIAPHISQTACRSEMRSSISRSAPRRVKAAWPSDRSRRRTSPGTYARRLSGDLG